MKSYRFVDGQFEYKYEIKHSLFIATIKNVEDENDANDFIKCVKKKYSDATHNCYAYVADEIGNIVRFSDDGEPGGTAGQPILEVLKKQKLYKTAIVVTRYFGGIKLGASGLVGAYTTAAVEGLKITKISEKVECKKGYIKLDYSSFATFNNIANNSSISLGAIDYGDEVSVEFFVPIDSVELLESKLKELFGGNINIKFEEALYFYSIK